MDSGPIPPPRPTAHAVAGAAGPYRGFSTSICDLFRDPSRRTDCCAFACCGLMASDRSRYLLLGERPPPLWRRVLLYAVIPCVLLASMSYFAVETPAKDPESGEDTTEMVAPVELRRLFWGYVIFAFAYRGALNMQMRMEVVRRVYMEAEEDAGREVDPARLATYLKSRDLEIFSAHRPCCCYAHDDMGINEPANERADFCTLLWNTVASMCCCCSQCWCQCCSICAIGQEEREVERLTGNRGHTMDYITFQRFDEYFPAIQAVNESQDRGFFNFLPHWRATSELSRSLLKNVAGVLIILTLFALSDIDRNFTFGNMIVLVLTLAQAFGIELLVHWIWNRFDLSFDSVVKYFSCGFFLATPLAIVFELIVQMLTSVVFFVIAFLFFVFAADDDLLQGLQDNPQKTMKKIAVEYQGIFILNLFLQSFVIAALVEEMVKYFGYWMVVVPDLMPQRTQTSVEEDGDDSAVTPTRSYKSTGAAITVAMVSVALGFACCENLMYVFVYSPTPSLGVEITTLVARSFFPVHPLCAAIQSIGVCKRDLEGERKTGIGRIISPAVLLHGAFDFVLMVFAYYQQVHKIEAGEDDDAPADATAVVEDDEDITEELPSLLCASVFVALGYAYYVCQSRAQTRRLVAMDDTLRDQNSTLL